MPSSHPPPSSANPVVWQPWSQLNLSRNPFGELTGQERAELAIIDPSQFADMKFARKMAVEFIGDCGRGKSTRLRWLQSRLPSAIYVYLPEDEPIPAIPLGDPLLIDEAQRLTRAVKNRVFASGIPLVLGTHRSLRRSLRRHGYAVQSVRIGDRNTPELAREVLNRRIEASRLKTGPIPVISQADARKLSRRFGSDIRSMEHFLYERLQNQVASSPVHSSSQENK